MLSYRHAFHAGNHADVLKHIVQTAVLLYLNSKDKPYWYIDTHSGSGLYALSSEYSQKNAEFKSGISKLWNRTDLPHLVKNYVELVRQCNPDDRLSFYPGSPYIADLILRKQDKLRLFELHSTEYKLLSQQFISRPTRAKIQHADGFDALKTMLPPPTKRALTLIDPSYEDKQDYRRVVSTLQESLERFANGCYCVWLPLLSRDDAVKLPIKLQKLPVKNWLYVSIQISQPNADGFGMYGSSIYLINQPYTLYEELQKILPWLIKVLAQDESANFQLKQQYT